MSAIRACCAQCLHNACHSELRLWKVRGRKFRQFLSTLAALPQATHQPRSLPRLPFTIQNCGPASSPLLAPDGAL